MKLTSQMIKEKAKELGIDCIGIGNIERFAQAPTLFAPQSYFPKAKSVIAVAMRIPRGTYRGIEEGSTYYRYTTMAVENMEETIMPMAQLKVAMYIEQQGALALPQRRHQQIMAAATVNPLAQRHSAADARDTKTARDLQISCCFSQSAYGYSRILVVI